MIQKICHNLKSNKMLTFLLGYGICYILAFFWLENRDVELHMVESKWDQYIPFCEYFIIPYFLWFVYIAVTVIYFVFFCKDRIESKRFIGSFCAGMTVFIAVSFFYPNGHNLRTQVEGDSILMYVVRLLHRIDTSTNILPSMHVYVTVANSVALLRQEELRKRRSFVPGVWILSILIILSTLFLKQHSVIDVSLALLLNIIFSIVIYKFPGVEVWRKWKKNRNGFEKEALTE